METGTAKKTISLSFINDKSPIIDSICKDLAASEMKVLCRSKNIEDGLSQLSSLNKLPKICIIDLDFYDQNVLVQLHKLKTEYPTIKLIAHSDIDDEKVGKSLLDIGFSSYLLLGSDVDDFKRVIETAMNEAR
ncbi:DNA-binding response regulator [Chryseobacterium indologenes]|uniref:DNA-binding response regulator n=1 Tax=Chryseobacterium indologenes TaxID=253 RepID=A0AAD0YYK8_CHRID|nr:response regulator transcription factor [Chryseobacterium indologenes]AZB17214.1 DNA-binding response regulator [Chryseobacterium indologenes]